MPVSSFGQIKLPNNMYSALKSYSMWKNKYYYYKWYKYYFINLLAPKLNSEEQKILTIHFKQYMFKIKTNHDKGEILFQIPYKFKQVKPCKIRDTFQVSILSTFYYCLFCTKVFCAAFVPIFLRQKSYKQKF